MIYRTVPTRSGFKNRSLSWTKYIIFNVIKKDKKFTVRVYSEKPVVCQPLTCSLRYDSWGGYPGSGLDNPRSLLTLSVYNLSEEIAQRKATLQVSPVSFHINICALPCIRLKGISTNFIYILYYNGTLNCWMTNRRCAHGEKTWYYFKS